MSRGAAAGPRGAGRAALQAAADGGWALVTGASSGIGAAYAELLVGHGAGVVLVSEDKPGLEAVADRLRERDGARVLTGCHDLSDPTAVDDVVALVHDRRIDLVINNAGIGIKGLFTEADPGGYLDLLHVNLVAPVLLTRALLPAMLDRDRGAVVHVASINALAPIGWSAVYSATKAFLLSYATAVWYENRHSGVAFQTLLPGTTTTAFHERSGSTRLPPWAMTPDAVAASSLAALGRDTVHVPGGVNRTFRAIGATLPLRAKTAAATNVMRRSLGV